VGVFGWGMCRVGDQIIVVGRICWRLGILSVKASVCASVLIYVLIKVASFGGYEVDGV
jgi:hypothetical protein